MATWLPSLAAAIALAVSRQRCRGLLTIASSATPASRAASAAAWSRPRSSSPMPGVRPVSTLPVPAVRPWRTRRTNVTPLTLNGAQRTQRRRLARACLAADRVYSAVGVHDLPGGRGEPVRQQRHAGARGRPRVRDLPAERRSRGPEILERGETR